jgi:hypothetical protein
LQFASLRFAFGFASLCNRVSELLRFAIALRFFVIHVENKPSPRSGNVGFVVFEEIVFTTELN